MPSPFAKPVAELTLARLRKSDAAAQTEVFRLFERAVYTLSLRMLGEPSAAMDALQDSFILAFQQAKSFRGDAPFGFWLRRVVLNRCLRELRDRKPSQELDEVDLTDLNCGSLTALTQAMDLEKALGQLTDRARAVLWLYHVEGFQHQEIADLFGKTTSFSKSQLSRALQQLREYLEPQPCLN
jgi:RNA polymerase sigma factor (sigma-70 family)